MVQLVRSLVEVEFVTMAPNAAAGAVQDRQLSFKESAVGTGLFVATTWRYHILVEHGYGAVGFNHSGTGV